MTPVPAAVALPAPASSVCAGRGGLLPAVCLDQALDELVDGAGLGQVTLVQQVAQLGLGLALVALAGLLVSLPVGCQKAALWGANTPLLRLTCDVFSQPMFSCRKRAH